MRTQHSSSLVAFATGLFIWTGCAAYGQPSASNDTTAARSSAYTSPDPGTLAAMRAGAQQGDAEDQSQLGRYYFYETKDYADAHAWFLKAALQGNAEAEEDVGDAYYLGKGVALNTATAAYWWQRASDLGDLDADYNLGVLYDKGLGVPQGDAKAARFYQKDAGAGDAMAQTNLALLYEAGHGVPQDYTQAASLLTSAANQGDMNAEFNLGLLYEHGRVSPRVCPMPCHGIKKPRRGATKPRRSVSQAWPALARPLPSPSTRQTRRRPSARRVRFCRHGLCRCHDEHVR